MSRYDCLKRTSTCADKRISLESGVFIPVMLVTHVGDGFLCHRAVNLTHKISKRDYTDEGFVTGYTRVCCIFVAKGDCFEVNAAKMREIAERNMS